MFKKLPLRWRLTFITALLITVCCIGLTVVLNFSAYRLVNSIDAAVITTPAQGIGDAPISNAENSEMVHSMDAENLQQAKQGYRTESIIYTIIAVLIGSALTYYISGKALRPVKALNQKVKNMNVHNLSQTLEVPPTKDEISELTQSFNEMTHKLEEAFLMQQRFSASAAHELRTPLAVLQTKIDVFNKKEQHTVEEYNALVSVMEKQTIRFRGLVSNLLDMTNMDDDYEQQVILLSDLFEDIFDELSHTANEKHVTLSMQCDENSVYGNADLLYRAFYNLVENAMKYNVQSGKVEVSAYSCGESKVEVSIKDTGIGIPDHLKKHIFEPFYRVDKSRSRKMGGAGLGLSIVDSIIKKHNGTVMVSNNESSGTCFTVMLPKVK